MGTKLSLKLMTIIYQKRNFFNKIKINQKVERIRNSGWINIYDLFTSKKKHNVWPRGLPLDELLNKKIFFKKKKKL